MIASLQKYSGISRAEYLKMDKQDIEYAYGISDIPQKTKEQIFKNKTDDEFLQRYINKRKGLVKNGV